MISVITCTIDPKRFEVFKTRMTTAMGSQSWELVPIRDARSLAEGYNRGIAASKGDVVVFCHDDIQVLNPDFPQRLLGHLAKFDMIGVAGASRLHHGRWPDAGVPYIFGQAVHPLNTGNFSVDIYGAPRRSVGNIQALDGLMMAVHRPVLSKISFDAATFDGFHHYDLDFSFAAYQAGFRLGVACDINLLHWSWGKFDKIWEKYKVRFDRKWASQLFPTKSPRSMWAAVEARTLAEVMEVLNPPHWRKEGDAGGHPLTATD